MHKYTFSPFAPNIFDINFDTLSLRFIFSNECEIFSSRVTFLLQNYIVDKRLMQNRDAHRVNRNNRMVGIVRPYCREYPVDIIPENNRFSCFVILS